MEREELREPAERGVLLTSRALGCGWPRRSLSRALRGEGWTRLQAGAWAEPGREPGLLIRLRAVQLLKPQLVVSHRSAAALWRIENLTRATEAPLEFTDPGLTLRREGTGVRVHRMPLAPAEVVEREGLRFTGAVRTLADLLRAGPRDDALVAVESALTCRRVGRVRRAPLTDLNAIGAALDAPLQGSVRARARLRMSDAGLRPESQAELCTPDGRRVVLDFLFRKERLAVEIEGCAYHGTRDSHRRDIARFNQVVQCPEVSILLRYTAEDVFTTPSG